MSSPRGKLSLNTKEFASLYPPVRKTIVRFHIFVLQPVSNMCRGRTQATASSGVISEVVDRYHKSIGPEAVRVAFDEPRVRRDLC